MGAVGVEMGLTRRPAPRPTRPRAFLDSARAAAFEKGPGVSLGDDLHARNVDDLVATGISWSGKLLHLVCFACP